MAFHSFTAVTRYGFWMSVSSEKTLFAGQPGTKKWLERCDNTLIRVRHKYNAVQKRKIEAVKLVVIAEPRDENKNRIPVIELFG